MPHTVWTGAERVEYSICASKVCTKKNRAIILQRKHAANKETSTTVNICTCRCRCQRKNNSDYLVDVLPFVVFVVVAAVVSRRWKYILLLSLCCRFCDADIVVDAPLLCYPVGAAAAALLWLTVNLWLGEGKVYPHTRATHTRTMHTLIGECANVSARYTTTDRLLFFVTLAPVHILRLSYSFLFAFALIALPFFPPFFTAPASSSKNTRKDDNVIMRCWGYVRIQYVCSLVLCSSTKPTTTWGSFVYEHHLSMSLYACLFLSLAHSHSRSRSLRAQVSMYLC